MTRDMVDFRSRRSNLSFKAHSRQRIAGLTLMAYGKTGQGSDTSTGSGLGAQCTPYIKEDARRVRTAHHNAMPLKFRLTAD